MKTDILFYKLLELEPKLLLHLAELDTPPGVEYQFQAIELKDMAKRTDAVLLPSSTDAPLIIAEVQFWRDSTIYHRIVSETARLLLQMPEYTNLQMVIIFPSRETDTGAGAWQPLVDVGMVRVLYLNETMLTMPPNTSPKQYSPEERAALLLIDLTIRPENEPNDRALLPAFSEYVRTTKNRALQRVFRDLFVSLYTSKYKHLTIDEVRTMINTAEIFDDIGESLAVQQYAEEYGQKQRLEVVPGFLRLGLSAEQIADVLKLPVETVRAMQPSTRSTRHDQP